LETERGKPRFFFFFKVTKQPKIKSERNRATNLQDQQYIFETHALFGRSETLKIKNKKDSPQPIYFPAISKKPNREEKRKRKQELFLRTLNVLGDETA
jgi:hypothetical protein